MQSWNKTNSSCRIITPQKSTNYVLLTVTAFSVSARNSMFSFIRIFTLIRSDSLLFKTNNCRQDSHNQSFDRLFSILLTTIKIFFNLVNNFLLTDFSLTSILKIKLKRWGVGGKKVCRYCFGLQIWLAGQKVVFVCSAVTSGPN